LLVRTLAGTRLLDHSNTYRFYNRRAAELALSFPPRHTGPLYMLEMLLQWVDGGMRILEVPTTYGARLGGDSSVVSQHGGRYGRSHQEVRLSEERGNLSIYR
jgi:hypothetical protein